MHDENKNAYLFFLIVGVLQGVIYYAHIGFIPKLDFETIIYVIIASGGVGFVITVLFALMSIATGIMWHDVYLDDNEIIYERPQQFENSCAGLNNHGNPSFILRNCETLSIRYKGYKNYDSIAKYISV